jgi:hypothetical protein
VREPREGTSGFFFKEVLWNLPTDERNAKMNRMEIDLGLKVEWDNIMMALAAPREVLPTVIVPIERPAIRERSEVFAVGQVQPVSEAHKLSEPTMQNASGPVTRELDKRGWLSDIKPAELTPSRRAAPAGRRADERGDNFRTWA